jgi:mRNA-degrading endonuclease YafQ of YafQ-DinJ toxin-antitoxin module
MRLRKTRQFDTDLMKLPKQIQDAARKQYKLFKADPHHPSLRVKKMQKFEDVWEGHITKGYVFTFRWDSDPKTGEQIAEFRRIGKHDEVYEDP